jgi:hypothetical protein
MAGARFHAGVSILFATGSGLSWENIILLLRNSRGHFPSQLKRSEREGNQLLSFVDRIRVRGAQIPVCLHDIMFHLSEEQLASCLSPDQTPNLFPLEVF